ncbi:reverse transcriptase domain-containing protein [Solwaraspora sp. WMMA2065]|uniref:reverse transcriptase domain-containing protein n=1 Tax=Solwaraspora sp. WMMA2065 TaxID=3015166 RepID=UPI00338D3EB2
MLRSAHYINNGYSWLVEGDIEGCFDEIRHSAVIERIRRRVADRKVINLCKVFLKAGLLTDLGRLERRVSGTPQGGANSPLFANLGVVRSGRADPGSLGGNVEIPHSAPTCTRRGSPPIDSFGTRMTSWSWCMQPESRRRPSASIRQRGLVPA